MTERKHSTHKSGDPFYSRKPWRHMREGVLGSEPLCRICMEQGHIRPATEVDHIVDRKDRPDLAYDTDNLQPLCKSCHSRKTMTTKVRRAATAKPPLKMLGD